MFPATTYTSRREKLRKLMKSGIILIPGNDESPMNYPANGYRFRQDSNFLYFFGLNHPGFAGIIDCDANKDIIFGNDVDIEDIIWMGVQPSVKEMASHAGITETAPFAELDSYLAEAIIKGKKIHFLPPYRAENKFLLKSLLDIKISNLKEESSTDLVKAVVALRSIKDKYEIEEIERACMTGYTMHTTAMKATKPGIYEREVAGAVEGVALCGGGTVSFPVICSVRGETLHNHYHGNIMKDGDLLMMDAGAETENGYASDYTRTLPVSGTFTQKQKEIYEIVLKANTEAIKAIKPGIPYQQIHLLAARIIAEGLGALGLMKGDAAEAVKQGAHAMFFPHGLGHMMGLDVHDMEDLGENNVGYDDEIKRIDQFGTAYLRLGRRLQEGFVLTVEPGIYFIPALVEQWKAEKKFMNFINYDKVSEYLGFGGVRIEDDILVTADGCRVLGKPVPKTVAEVEAMMKS
ncbi:MAG: aminopeptidase P family protein [Bacteroidota bacterium]